MRFFFFMMALIAFFACKNQPSTAQTQESADKSTPVPAPPPPPRDTVWGWKGTAAAVAQPNANSVLLRYANYYVGLEDRSKTVGQTIRIKDRFGSPVGDFLDWEACYFKGIQHNCMLVDKGTGPDGRTLLVYDLSKQGKVYEAVYVGEPSVTEDGKLVFYQPVAKKVVTPLPACPDAQKWKKDGLRVVYGQQMAYDLKKGGAPTKGGFECFAGQ